MEKLPNSNTCFVCGEKNAAGLKVRFYLNGEVVQTTLRVPETHCGYAGVVHGGILATLLDETMGWAPALENRRFCVAIELNVEYRKSVPAEKEIIVSGWATSADRRIWVAEGEIKDAEGTVYAKGRGRYMPISDDQTAEVTRNLNFDESTVTPDRISRVPI